MEKSISIQNLKVEITRDGAYGPFRARLECDVTFVLGYGSTEQAACADAFGRLIENLSMREEHDRKAGRVNLAYG